MKETKIISQGIGSWKAEGIYDEEDDGNHRCSWCGKKMRTGQQARAESSPNTSGYRRTDIHYFHKKC